MKNIDLLLSTGRSLPKFIFLLFPIFLLALPSIAQGDPDMPASLAGTMSKEEFMMLRAEGIAMKRGIEKDKPFDPMQRINAVRQMEAQKAALAANSSGGLNRTAALNWTEIGPNPIPNGQVLSGTQLPVSGRTIAIAVHPTNANIVYVGTAQGGLYRTTDGGTTWLPILDNALSLAIGSVAICPSQPETIYVGTGEHNFSGDSFFGVGIYRIDNASSGSPTITGPLGSANFAGRGISKIIVHPTNPATIFVASTSGIGGILGTAPGGLPNRGVYRSTDATSGAPTFTQIGVLASPNDNLSVRDIAIDPSNPDILLANLVVSGGGIYRSINALSATPTWTQVFLMALGVGTNNLTAEFAAIHPVGDLNATFYAATGNTAGGTGTGRVLKSTDGGATFAQINGIAFCNPQCFYNIAVAVDPTNVNNVYVGGTGAAGTFAFSTNGGTNFTVSQDGLHTDTHAIAVAPSSPTTIYYGSDGGIYKSTNSGGTWTSLNSAGFRATQFMGIAVHPTNPNFTIGGTQDNGTNYRNSAGVWTRSDFGDGGYTVIDQNAVNTTNVDMYHTYFNSASLNAYAYTNSSATTEGGWIVRGCNGIPGNGITCSSPINFYAPLERGPGNPNTIYYGSNRLHRSANLGVLHTTVSQAFASAISAIGISPQNDNVRIIGRNDGGVFGTTTGAAVLTDLDAGGTIPPNTIGRAVISPTDVNTAYITLCAFGQTSVWKTTNLNNVNPTWTASAGSGLTAIPPIPVNAFLVVPTNSNILFAGTDIGVYVSLDAGVSWNPLGTGLPVVAVFGMAFTSTGYLRIATHGRGMWEVPIYSVLPTKWLSITGNINSQKQSVITWKLEERGVGGYEIEKSVDGINFTRIGTVNSKGDGINTYSFTETPTLVGTGFYRVRQVDFDGKFTLSSIVKLVAGQSTFVSAFPIPTDREVSITVGSSLLKSKAQIVDMNGKVMSTFVVQHLSFILDISRYARGVYFLKFDNGTVQKLEKL